MKIYALTAKGTEKSHSDDRILADNVVLCEAEYSAEISSPKIIAVADGIGSYNGSDRAAQFVCEYMSAYSGDDSLLQDCAEALMKFAEESPAERLMGTTFTALAFCGDFCKVLHIGNTRAYSMCGRYLKPLTKDHTTYQWYMTAGLTEKAESCNKSEITYCFGAGSMRYFQPIVKEISPGGGFVLTSDGIHDFLSADELESLVFADGDDYMNACRHIADAAVNNGSYDDISIIIAVP
ncbi:MAG: PP2C family protein-serine/threonine phosphatase [Oscillospiraceae bacterium]